MKSFFTLGLFALLSFCGSAFDVKTLDSGDLHNHPKWNDFNSYMISHGKQYTSGDVYTRFYNFVDNLKLVELQANETHCVSMNKFADLSAEEFHNEVGLGCFTQPERIGFHRTKSTCGQYKPTSSSLPKSIDWREKGVVTPVKNQGQCGSCWSFSATGAMEGAWAVATGNLISLSEQQLVDCSISYGDMACKGGLMDNAFAYAIDNGMCSEEDDPYEAKRGSCDDCDPVVHISSCMDVEPNNQMALQAAVAQGPVSVAIEADKTIFQFYTSGVINSSKCGTKLDHGVLVVGYGEEDNMPYWLVKNSWGPEWGDNGYVKIARSNSTDDAGVCGIAMQPSFPTANVGYQGTSCGTCGLSYQACCAGFATKGYPCDCHLCDDGHGKVGPGCGDCGTAYQLCCIGFEKEGDPCQCDVA